MKDTEKPVEDPKVKVIVHGDYSWFYERGDLEHGAYSLSDPDGRKVAVIFPFDKNRPMDTFGKNARLLTREYGSEEWREHVHLLGFRQAFSEGTKHADRYRAEMTAKELIEDMAGMRSSQPENAEKVKSAIQEFRELARTSSQWNHGNDRGTDREI